MARLKDEFMLDPSVTFLNHGSFGAVPRPVFEAYQGWQRELERQPVEFLGRRFNDLMRGARQSLASYLGTQAGNVVFTQNVTIALNIVAHALELAPGDEVLATDHEYGALDRTWRLLSKERGFAYINQPVPVPVGKPEQVVESLWRGVTPRTKVIFLSHITSPTALIFPVSEITRRAREAGILTVIDGAHAPGQLSLDLDGLGADFYGGNLHKWLCAPKGAGFLYARPEAQHLLKPLVVSWGYESDLPGDSTFIDHHEWWGTRDPAAFLAVDAAIRFQQEHGWDRVRQDCHALAVEAHARILELTGPQGLHKDDDWFAQMVSAPLPSSVNIEMLKSGLYDRFRIEVPVMAWKDLKLVRVSIQAYNTREDVERLLEALQQLLSERDEVFQGGA